MFCLVELSSSWLADAAAALTGTGTAIPGAPNATSMPTTLPVPPRLVQVIQPGEQESHVSSVDLMLGSPGGVLGSGGVCLGFEHIFIALFLVILILMTVLGNVLVVLSVFLYKRMRTFTNFLLTSLATADLLVGLLIMPLSLIDLLHQHRWPFGRLLCRIWATMDVLLCTASILNLCIISLDRYMAITSPLKYPRTRSRSMAIVRLCLVWGEFYQSDHFTNLAEP